MRLPITLALALAFPAFAAQPVITSTPRLTTPVNVPYRYDLDGRIDVTGTSPIDLRLQQAPQGMDMDNLTGEIFWLPTVSGDHPVTIIASNAEGTDQQSFVVTVAMPDAPVINPVAVQEVNQGLPLQLQLSATGAAPMVWTMESGPSSSALHPTTGMLTWFPSATGPVTFVFTAANSVGSDRHTWNVEVIDPLLPTPTAAFTRSPPIGDAPLLVNFDATGSVSNHPTEPVVTHNWDFGDGSPTRVGYFPLLTHGYLQPGSYRAKLTVSNLYLKTNTLDALVQVTKDGGLPPTARIVADVTKGPAPLRVSFRCECAEGNSAIVGFEWDYGDGEGSVRGEPVHVYAKSGGFNVKLRVTDARGLEANDNIYIGVGLGDKLPPYARARALPVTGDTPLTVQLVSEFGDPDGIVVNRRWSLPDGSMRTDTDPLIVIDQVGTHSAKLTVTDTDGLTSTDTVELRVTRNGVLPPKIISTPNLQAVVGEPYQYDEDGRAAARGGLPIMWDLGKIVGNQLVNAPEGMEIERSTGRITWTPQKTQQGEVRVSLSVTNGAGTSVQDFTLQVADQTRSYWVACSTAPGVEGLWLLTALGLLRRRRR